jgi:nanoRNase/pAp phosphatase (c-di-AMP/oligoRNAs hydrolase)
MKITEMSRTRLRRLLKAFNGLKSVLILTHDYPDPDAIASSLALQRLLSRRLKGCRVDVGFGGIVGRAENRAMVKAVRASFRPADEIVFASYDGFALVDTQPRTGNNSLPQGKVPAVVLDHHPMRRETRRVKFHDIRTRFGATATMMYEYLKTARFRIDADLATALFYGIRAETQALTREASRADRDAYVALLPLADFRRISDIENAGVSREYFGQMGSALAHTRLYGDVSVTSLGTVPNPDFCAEFCDMVMRLESMRWALCVGRKKGTLYLSLRTRERRGHAGRTIVRVVGKEGKAGGHGMMAGGIAWIEKFDPPTYDSALKVIRKRFLEQTQATDRKPMRLLDAAPSPLPPNSEKNRGVPSKAAVSS